MISGAAIAVGYRLRREVDPSESRLDRDACPKPTSVLPPTSLSHAAGGAMSGTSIDGLALQAVARAPADGYTLLQVATTHGINVTLYEKNTVTVTREIVPIASTNRDFFVLLVNPSFPAKTIAEFIAYAKANPGKINIASNGTGNLTHLAGELFRMMTGIEIVHVPYPCTPAPHSALIARHVHAICA